MSNKCFHLHSRVRSKKRSISPEEREQRRNHLLPKEPETFVAADHPRQETKSSKPKESKPSFNKPAQENQDLKQTMASSAALHNNDDASKQKEDIATQKHEASSESPVKPQPAKTTTASHEENVEKTTKQDKDHDAKKTVIPPVVVVPSKNNPTDTKPVEPAKTEAAVAPKNVAAEKPVESKPATSVETAQKAEDTSKPKEAVVVPPVIVVPTKNEEKPASSPKNESNNSLKNVHAPSLSDYANHASTHTDNASVDKPVQKPAESKPAEPVAPAQKAVSTPKQNENTASSKAVVPPVIVVPTKDTHDDKKPVEPAKTESVAAPKSAPASHSSASVIDSASLNQQASKPAQSKPVEPAQKVETSTKPKEAVVVPPVIVVPTKNTHDDKKPVDPAKTEAVVTPKDVATDKPASKPVESKPVAPVQKAEATPKQNENTASSKTVVPPVIVVPSKNTHDDKKPVEPAKTEAGAAPKSAPASLSSASAIDSASLNQQASKPAQSKPVEPAQKVETSTKPKEAVVVPPVIVVPSKNTHDDKKPVEPAKTEAVVTPKDVATDKPASKPVESKPVAPVQKTETSNKQNDNTASSKAVVPPVIVVPTKDTHDDKKPVEPAKTEAVVTPKNVAADKPASKPVESKPVAPVAPVQKTETSNKQNDSSASSKTVVPPVIVVPVKGEVSGEKPVGAQKDEVSGSSKETAGSSVAADNSASASSSQKQHHCVCYGAKMRDAVADAAKHVNAAGQGEARKKAVIAAESAPQKPKTVYGPAVHHEAQAQPGDSASTIKEKKQKKVTMKDRFGSVLSILIIFLSFFLPLFLIVEVINGNISWDQYTSKRFPQKASVETVQEPVVATPEPVAAPVIPVTTPPEVVAPEPAPVAPIIIPVVAESPVVKQFSYGDATFIITSYDGNGSVSYPDTITSSEFSDFLAWENDRHGSELSAVTVSYSTGMATLSYPSGISRDDRTTYVDILADDILAYLSRPLEKHYDNGTFNVHMMLSQSKGTLTSTGSVTIEDIKGFVAYEKKRYAELASAVSVTMDEKTVTVSYPAGLSSDLLASYADTVNQDLVDYLASLQADQGVVTVPQCVEPPAFAPIIRTYDDGEFSVHMILSEDNGTITCTKEFSADDINGFLDYEQNRYPELVPVVSVSVSDASVVVGYPSGQSADALNAYADDVNQDILDYLASFVVPESTPLPPEKVKTVSSTIAISLYVPVEKKYDDGSFSVTFILGDGKGTVKSDGSFTSRDIDGFLAYEQNRYPELASLVSVSLTDSVLSVTYPAGISTDDIASYADTVNQDILDYLASLVVVEPEPVAPVVAVTPSVVFTRVEKHYESDAGAVDMSFGDGDGTITFASVSSGFLDYEKSVFGEGLSSLAVASADDGSVTVSYQPGAFSEEDVSLLCDVVYQDYCDYLASLVVVEPEPVAPVATPAAVAFARVEKHYESEASGAVDMSFGDGDGTITFATDSYLAGFSDYEKSVFGEGLSSITVASTGNGTVAVSYQAGAFSEEDVSVLCNVVYQGYCDYLASLSTVFVPVERSYDDPLFKVSMKLDDGAWSITWDKRPSTDAMNGFLEYEQSVFGEGYASLASSYDDGVLSYTYESGAFTSEELSLLADVINQDIVDYFKEEPAAVVVVTPEPIAEKKPAPTFGFHAHEVRVGFGPYALSYYDFYNARQVLINNNISFQEFLSRYGFSVSAGYRWNFTKAFFLDVDFMYNRFYLQRSIFVANTQYQQILADVKIGWNHMFTSRIGMFLAVGAGVDLSSLQSRTLPYISLLLDVGISYRLTEHWEMWGKLTAGVTLQPMESDTFQSSNTYFGVPVSIGVSYKF